MACGTPVICSNVTSLPEIGGSAALISDPMDINSFAAHIAQVIASAALGATMRANGIAQAQRFSWQKAVTEILESYDRALQSRFFTEIISPYRIPVFNQLAAYSDIDLKVIFASETEGLRLWRVPKEQIQFAYEVLPGFVLAQTYQNGSLFFNPTIVQVSAEESLTSLFSAAITTPRIGLRWHTAKHPESK